MRKNTRQSPWLGSAVLGALLLASPPSHAQSDLPSPGTTSTPGPAADVPEAEDTGQHPASAPAPGALWDAGHPPYDRHRVAARNEDREGPALEHTPLIRAVAGAPTAVTARATDLSGVAAVWLEYRTNPADNFATVPMTLDAHGQYAATLATPTDATVVEYRVGARDQGGNVTLLGSAAPLQIELYVPAPTPRAGAARGTDWHKALVALIGIFALAGLLRRRPAAHPTTTLSHGARAKLEERRFWRRLLKPLLEIDGDHQIDAVRLLATRKIHHPTLGVRQFSAPYLMDRLVELQRATTAVHSDQADAPPPVPAERQRARGDRTQPAARPERAPSRSQSQSPVPSPSPSPGAPFDESFADEVVAEITGHFSRLQMAAMANKPQAIERLLREELGIDVRLLADCQLPDDCQVQDDPVEIDVGELLRQ